MDADQPEQPARLDELVPGQHRGVQLPVRGGQLLHRGQLQQRVRHRDDQRLAPDAAADTPGRRAADFLDTDRERSVVPRPAPGADEPERFQRERRLNRDERRGLQHALARHQPDLHDGRLSECFHAIHRDPERHRIAHGRQDRLPVFRGERRAQRRQLRLHRDRHRAVRLRRVHDADEHADDHADDHADQDSDHHSDAHCHADRNTDLVADAHTDGDADQYANQPRRRADQHADEHADEDADLDADAHAGVDADQYANQHRGRADQHVHEHADGYQDTDQYADEHTDEHADEYADAHGHEHADEHADSDAPGRADGAVGRLR